MKKQRPLIVTIAVFSIMGGFIFSAEYTKQGIMRGLNLCAEGILPNLYPFFILSDLWIRSGAANWLSEKLAPIMELLFHLPGTASIAFLLGNVGGKT